jgi:superfamily II DNA helicase RecQ
MKRHLQQATEAGLGQKINVAAYRHIAIAISRRWVRPSSAFTDEETIDDGDEIADDQATYSLFTAGAVYAREMQELPGSMASRRQQFRTASVDWYRFLGFGSSIRDEVQRGVKRKGDPFQAHSKRARIEREHRVKHIDVAEEMAWMMGQNVSLRSVQGEALSAIKNGEGEIVVVMPTGASKSMLFMLLAFVGVGGVTVVVVLFVTLRHDMKGRSEKVGVSVGE